MLEHRPIKRDPAIAALSRDHHYGLLLVWKIYHGIKKEIAPGCIANYILFFFEKELEPHFTDEEQFLFPLLDNQEPLRIQAENEHEAIRNLVKAIKQNDKNLGLVQQFAKLLELHIRFEERELFNFIQDTTDEKLLNNITARLHDSDHNTDNTWTDKFWE